MPDSAPWPEGSGDFLALRRVFPCFPAEHRRGAGGRAVLPGGLIYTAVAVPVSRRPGTGGSVVMRSRLDFGGPG